VRADGLACGLKVRQGTATAGTVTLNQLLDALAPLVGRAAVDRTGLTGTFDFQLDWQGDSLDALPTDSTGPSLFQAIQEQLGLRLDARRGPVDVLVIDHIARPSPN
jgi:uncharacterized protein (TIGR03435 family)